MAHEFSCPWFLTDKAINPVSKINWEGTGVEPDMKVSAAAKQAVDDAEQAVAFLKKALGATENYRLTMSNGTIYPL